MLPATTPLPLPLLVLILFSTIRLLCLMRVRETREERFCSLCRQLFLQGLTFFRSNGLFVGPATGWVLDLVGRQLSAASSFGEPGLES